MSAFSELGLSEKSLAAIKDLGYIKPTPVQERSIPLVLKGRDVIAAAKTGTGKTAAFALPVLDTLPHRTGGESGPFMLVLSPTRELANQIGETCMPIGKHTGHFVAMFVGGVKYDPQIKKLERGIDVAIATPGRLIDLMERGAIDLSAVRVLVIDEADRMLDMGFWPQVERIVEATPSEHQTLLFSATIDRSQDKIMFSLLSDPEIVAISNRGDTADKVDQYLIHTTRRQKPELLNALIKEKGGFRVIVFTRTKGGADNAAKRLKRIGIPTEAIHADRSQAQRTRALENFRIGKTNVLVATDVLARGIDVSEVDYVVNYDLPMMPEDYVHRIGRTGRAGATGIAFSLSTPETKGQLKSIQRFIGKTIDVMEFKVPDNALEALSDDDPRIANQHRIAEEERRAANEKRGSSKAEGRRRTHRHKTRKHDGERTNEHRKKMQAKAEDHKHNHGSNDRTEKHAHDDFNDSSEGGFENDTRKTRGRKYSNKQYFDGRGSKSGHQRSHIKSDQRNKLSARSKSEFRPGRGSRPGNTTHPGRGTGHPTERPSRKGKRRSSAKYGR